MLTDLSGIVELLSSAVNAEVKTAILVLTVVVGGLVIFKVSSKGIRSAIFRAGGREGDAHMLVGFWKFVVTFIASIIIIDQLFHLGALLAVFGAFGGLLLGWSLREPVSGFFAWIVITLKRPFRAGDRIQLPSSGLVGDVIEVGPMYTILNQVGGAVGSEDVIGRHVLIPNSMLFSNLIVNYTPSSKIDLLHKLEGQSRKAHILDEVVVKITFNSDWDTAESILINAARESTRDIIRETELEPYVRSEMYDYGVKMRLRYMTLATDRPRVSHEITKRIFKEFTENTGVDFAIPYVYSSKRPLAPIEPKRINVESTRPLEQEY